jgi:hypothetical protein
MDIKQELEKIAGFIPVGESVRKVARAALAEIERLESQLPDGMKDCTILYLECPKGHGRLTGANWVQRECHWCEIERLELEVRLQRSAKNQARADLVKFTDRMIAAGLMS